MRDFQVKCSKFAELRPKHRILVGANSTHSVCVCTIHQNVKLMMMEIQLPELPTYHYCLARIMCNPPHSRWMWCLSRDWGTESRVTHTVWRKWHGLNCLQTVGFHWQIHTWDILVSSRGICWFILWQVKVFCSMQKSRLHFIPRRTTLKAAEFSVTADFSHFCCKIPHHTSTSAPICCLSSA